MHTSRGLQVCVWINMSVSVHVCISVMLAHINISILYACVCYQPVDTILYLAVQLWMCLCACLTVYVGMYKYFISACVAVCKCVCLSVCSCGVWGTGAALKLRSLSRCAFFLASMPPLFQQLFQTRQRQNQGYMYKKTRQHVNTTQIKW